MIKIDTIEDFLKYRETEKPIYIMSSTKGKVEVPCCNTLLVNRDLLMANAYNPNSVAADKLKLLEQSIVSSGFCFAIVTIFDADLNKFVIIDGFHRNMIGGPGWLDFDYVPIVVLKHSITERMAATIRFNKARGIHQIDLDAEVIRALIEQGLNDEEVAEKLGMEVDAVYRYKQITGVAEIFKNANYSLGWEMVD